MPPMSEEIFIEEPPVAGACSADELVELLHDSYLHVLLVDVRDDPDVLIPGTCQFEFIQEMLEAESNIESATVPSKPASLAAELMSSEAGVDVVGSAETPSPNSTSLPVLGPSGLPLSLDDTATLNAHWATINDSVFSRRVGSDIIVFDADGRPDGRAARVAAAFAREGKCLTSRYLADGMNNFSTKYPNLVHLSSPYSSLSHALSPIPQGPYLHSSTLTLHSHQTSLVTSVWYTSSGDKPSPIIPDFLYLGSCYAAKPEYIRNEGIKHVVRLGWGFSNWGLEGEVQYYDFKIEDSVGEPIGELFEVVGAVLEGIRQKGEKVLVHCHAGVSRSATLILSYLILHHNLTLLDAWNKTYLSRPIIRPNEGFAQVLQELEKRHFGVPRSSVPTFWMSDSYVNYLSYLEWTERVRLHRAAKKGHCANGVPAGRGVVEE